MIWQAVVEPFVAKFDASTTLGHVKAEVKMRAPYDPKSNGNRLQSCDGEFAFVGELTSRLP